MYCILATKSAGPSAQPGTPTATEAAPVARPSIWLQAVTTSTNPPEPSTIPSAAPPQSCPRPTPLPSASIAPTPV